MLGAEDARCLLDGVLRELERASTSFSPAQVLTCAAIPESSREAFRAGKVMRSLRSFSEVPERGLRVENVERKDRGELTDRPVARGDQHPPVAGLRQAVRQVLGRFDVVEHQQPALLAAGEALKGAIASLSGREALDMLAKLDGQRRQIGDAAVLGMNPGDDVVLVAVGVDVAGRQLRLADAAQPADRLRDERPPVGGERPLERVELVTAAGERLQPRRDPEPERRLAWPHAASGPAEFRFRKGRVSALGRGRNGARRVSEFRRRRRCSSCPARQDVAAAA